MKLNDLLMIIRAVDFKFKKQKLFYAYGESKKKP